MTTTQHLTMIQLMKTRQSSKRRLTPQLGGLLAHGGTTELKQKKNQLPGPPAGGPGARHDESALARHAWRGHHESARGQVKKGKTRDAKM